MQQGQVAVSKNTVIGCDILKAILTMHIPIYNMICAHMLASHSDKVTQIYVDDSAIADLRDIQLTYVVVPILRL